MPERRHVEAAAGLVLGQHAGDVVVDHDHLVDLAVPLLGEDADRGRAAADPHALLGLAVDDRAPGRPGRRRVLPPSIASSTGSPPQSASSISQVTLPAFLVRAGQMVDAAQRQHLRAVLGRGHVADRLALHGDRRALGAEMAVGVDLHLGPAIGEDALGDDGDGVDALVGRADDEGGRLVVGIGGAGADAGDEGLDGRPALRVPSANGTSAARRRPLGEEDGSVRTSEPFSLA